jgi:hypothetical protein
LEGPFWHRSADAPDPLHTKKIQRKQRNCNVISRPAEVVCDVMHAPVLTRIVYLYVLPAENRSRHWEKLRLFTVFDRRKVSQSRACDRSRSITGSLDKTG